MNKIELHVQKGREKVCSAGGGGGVEGWGGVGIRESKQRERISFNSGPLTGS